MLTALHPLLATHYAIGLLVVVAAVAGIFFRPVRRFVIYALVLQIVLGTVAWYTLHLSVPPAHWILSLLVGGVYSAASIAEKRGQSPRLVAGLAMVGALVIALVFHLGQRAANHS
jgi:hypothetical protein